jgi:hypothetical protein
MLYFVLTPSLACKSFDHRRIQPSSEVSRGETGRTHHALQLLETISKDVPEVGDKTRRKFMVGLLDLMCFDVTILCRRIHLASFTTHFGVSYGASFDWDCFSGGFGSTVVRKYSLNDAGKVCNPEAMPFMKRWPRSTSGCPVTRPESARRRSNQFAVTSLNRTLGQEGLGTLQREFHLLPLDAPPQDVR